MSKVYIVSAVRTPIGKFGGVFANLPVEQLGAIVIKEAVRRAGIRGTEVSEVLMGCVIQANQGQNVARQAAIHADIPIEVPASTINNVCGSSLKCVNLAAALIKAGEAEVVVAGGMENMSAAPYALDKARFGYRMNDGKLSDTMICDALWDAFHDYHMGVTAENVAQQYHITRQEQDAFAAESQQKCQRAREHGKFLQEIVPVTVKMGKQMVEITADEYPRDGVTAESIGKLRPAFCTDGTVTAANSSGINDGAAAVVLMSEQKVKELGIEPMAEWVAGASVGVEPDVMGIGAGAAAISVMKKAGVTVDALTRIEANEAFAAQSIASARIAGWDKEMEKVNVNGGAISLGHPVGASGVRILVTLLYELQRCGGGKGLATLCVGGGMGVATIVAC